MSNKLSSVFGTSGHAIISLFVLAILAMMLIAGCSDSSSSGSSSDSGTNNTGSNTGRGGSTARMTIAGNYLYAISGSAVQLFDINQPATPNPWTKVQVDWDIETLFPYENYLLIGAANGLHILDNTDPANPYYRSDLTHARARDPVVARGGYAYVTLKSESDTVQGSDNSPDPGSLPSSDVLNVIDIRDIDNPILIDTISMQGPSGLSIDGDLLFVCDDVAGLKIFDVSDPQNLSIRNSILGVECNDVIAEQGLLYVLTEDSLLQYDYSTLPPVLQSQLTVGTSLGLQE
jgi:hypothetical protein